MAMEGQLLLSKVIEAGTTQPLTLHNLKRSDFQPGAEQAAYDFVMKYAAENDGAAPSYATYVEYNRKVTYIPEVTDSFEYLAGRLKDATGKRMIAEYLNSPEFERDYAELSTDSFINRLTSRTDRIKLETRTGVPNVTDISNATVEFLDEYRARKAGTSFKIWLSKFARINEAIGGYLSGNMYAWYGRSGRGKSVIVMEEALEAAFQGATVLLWILEMNRFEWMARAYSSISARVSDTVQRIDGVDYNVGFDNKRLLMGKLDDAYERGLEQFCAALNEIIPGKILLRATDSEGFIDRGIANLEADINETSAEVVVVDPIYLMDFEANTSRVAGGDVAETSKKLRRMAGRLKVTLHVVTQADEVKDDENADGVRELVAPKRAEVKKTKAILEDATNLLGVDTLNNEGLGAIWIKKGRNGGEDTRVEIVYLPNYGVVRELNAVIEAGQFADVSGF
ncbi:AAA family ATPase [Paenibacillus xylanilyticus]|uniref:AAA family ATPase n=1 Tax=Paenibacillus xylanilyticus TaxID=248903 RepID=UPI003AAE6BED